MFVQLEELRQPHVSINDPKASTTLDGLNPLAGFLGSVHGQPIEVQKTRFDEASKDANDLTNLVKRKKPIVGDTGAGPKADVSQTDSKRKVQVLEGDDGTELKKTKIETNHGGRIKSKSGGDVDVV